MICRIKKGGSPVKLVCFLQHFRVEDESPFSFQGSVVDHVERSLICEIFGDVGTGWFFGFEKIKILVDGGYEF